MMQTHSNHRLLSPDRLGALLNAVGDAIDGAGGVLPLDVTDLPRHRPSDRLTRTVRYLTVGVDQGTILQEQVEPSDA